MGQTMMAAVRRQLYDVILKVFAFQEQYCIWKL